MAGRPILYWSAFWGDLMNWLQSWAARLFGLQEKKGKVPPVHNGTVLVEGQEIHSDWHEEKAVREGYKRSVWVASSVREIMTAASSVPIRLEKKVGEGWREQPKHPLQALLNQPNDFMSRQDMAARWAQHMSLSGNAIFWLNIAGGRVLEVWPMLPDQVKPIPSLTEFISGYKWYGPNALEKVFRREEIIHWQYPDPSEPRWGLSPLQAAAQAVDLDLAAARWNRKTLVNDGKPPIGIMLSEHLDQEQVNYMSGMIQDQISGEHVRKALILAGVTGITPLAMNATDLDYLNGRKFSKEEIAAAFGVPPVLLTVGEGATYANLDAALTILWESRIMPMLRDYCEGWELSLFGFYGLDKASWRIVPDISEVRPLQANIQVETAANKNRAEIFSILVSAKVPPSQAAEAAGLDIPDLPDEPPAPDPPPVAPQPPQDEGDERPEEKPPPKAQKKSQENDSAPDREGAESRREAWITELARRIAKIFNAQGRRISEAYEAGDDWENEIRDNEWADLLRATYRALIESEGQIIYSELQTITNAFGASGFDAFRADLLSWIDQYTGAKIGGISQTTRDGVVDEIRRAIELGKSTSQTGAALRVLHSGWANWRAEMIARTEIADAMGEAHLRSAKQFSDDYELELEKTWNRTKDHRTREEHVKMDGETVGLDEPFSNGLQSPKEHGCRCVVTYREKR